MRLPERKGRLDKASHDLLVRMPENTKGRDFAVSDVHGYYDHLSRLLDTVGFDEATDRLFIIGDLVDRGPKSLDSIDWMRRPYVFASLGNHDYWCLQAGQHGELLEHWQQGGKWFYDLDENDRADLLYCLYALPLAYEVKGKDGKLFGMVHAECTPDDWLAFTRLITTGEGYTDLMLQELLLDSIWLRDRVKLYDTSIITSVDRVFVGHSSLKEVITLGNVTYIDTGICYEDGMMTIIDINTMQTWSEKK